MARKKISISFDRDQLDLVIEVLGEARDYDFQLGEITRANRIQSLLAKFKLVRRNYSGLGRGEVE